MEDRLKKLEEQVATLVQWMDARKVQQLSYPVDDASKSALGVPVGRGTGNGDTTQVVSIPAGGGSATVPANPSGTVLLQIEGVVYEIPYL